MKLDWSKDGWRVFPDAARFHQQEPLQVIPHNIRIAGPVELCLGHGDEQNKGWVYVPDGMELEVLV